MADDEVPDPWGGFGIATRDMYLRAPDLRLVRSWSDNEGEDAGPSALRARDLITGWVEIEKDSITIIGSGLKPVSALSFRLFSYSDTTELAADWAEYRKTYGQPSEALGSKAELPDGASAEHARVNAIIYEELAARPPTATVGRTPADRETGVKECWWLECKVPQAVFASISSDLVNGLCKEARMSVEIPPGFVSEEYAWLSEPIIFGIQGSFGHGWIGHLSWTVASTEAASSSRPALGFGDDEEDQGVADVGEALHETSAGMPQPDNGLAAAHREIERLARTARRGFALVLALVAILTLLSVVKL